MTSLDTYINESIRRILYATGWRDSEDRTWTHKRHGGPYTTPEAFKLAADDVEEAFDG